MLNSETKRAFHMKTKLLFSLAIFSLSTFADTTFTTAEVAAHKTKLGVIIPTTSKCIERIYDDHIDFHGRYGVSKYYGDRRQDYATRAGRLAALKSYNAPASLIDELTPISCIGLTVKCLGEGFIAGGQKATWDKILSNLRSNGMDGTFLQADLRKLGWKVLYWNPDPASNAKWDEEDLRLSPLKPGTVWNPVWGGHAYRYSQLKKTGKYYNVPVDDMTMMVGFKDQQPEAFKKAPFFVGSAHAGYHVFPGSFGHVIEAHSMRNLDSILNLESSPFNPLATGGGPRWTKTEKYRSGIVAIPPGF